MAADPALALVAIWRLEDFEWGALEVQEWFPYKYVGEKITMLPKKLPLVRRSASCAKVREGGRLEVLLRYRV